MLQFQNPKAFIRQNVPILREHKDYLGLEYGEQERLVLAWSWKNIDSNRFMSIRYLLMVERTMLSFFVLMLARLDIFVVALSRSKRRLSTLNLFQVSKLFHSMKMSTSTSKLPGATDVSSLSDEEVVVV